MPVSSVDRSSPYGNAYSSQDDDFMHATQNFVDDTEHGASNTGLARGNPVQPSGITPTSTFSLSPSQTSSAEIEANLHFVQQYVSQGGYDPVQAITDVRQIENSLRLNANQQSLTSDQRANLNSSLGDIRNTVYSQADSGQINEAISSYRSFLSGGDGTYNFGDSVERELSLTQLIGHSTVLTEQERRSALDQLSDIHNLQMSGQPFDASPNSLGSNPGDNNGSGGSGGTALGVIGSIAAAGLLLFGSELGG